MNTELRQNKCDMSVWAVVIVAIIIIADQTMKIWVKTSFYLGENLPITSWWHLKFIENNGMAFGVELWSKLVLTLGRIVAVVILGWILFRIARMSHVRKGFIVAVALVTAGAAGNIFDCVFYGQIFNDPMPPETAVLFPQGGGYAGWFEGRVVDMLYFPLFNFVWPEWVPFVGGTEYEFFQYIFNIADSSICIGMAMLLLFYTSDVGYAWNTLSGKPDTDDKSKN